MEGAAEVVGVAEGIGVEAVEAAGPIEGTAEVAVDVTTEVEITDITGEVETNVTIESGSITGTLTDAESAVTIELQDVVMICTNGPFLVGLFKSELRKVYTEAATYNILDQGRTYKNGVTYSSGFGDYAEWIERENKYEFMRSGDIVAVNGGLITKNISNNYNQLLVISTNPAILGNIPEVEEQHLYEKVAFMGQIPVKIYGSANRGDFILYSGFNDGSGFAVSPEDIKPEQYKKIVGVAWSSKYGKESGYVNMSIGLNGNTLTKLAENHENRITQLEDKIININERVSKIENRDNIIPNEKMNLTLNDKDLNNSFSNQTNNHNEIYPKEISPEFFNNYRNYLISAIDKNSLNKETEEAALLYLNDGKFEKAYKNRMNQIYKDHILEFHPELIK